MAHFRPLPANSQLRPFIHVATSAPTAPRGMARIGTKPSFGQSVVNVGFRMNWPFAGLPRSARQLAGPQGSDFAGNGSHAKIAAAAPLTKNPTSEVVAHFLKPTGYLAQWYEHGAPTPTRAPPFSRICSVLGRQSCVFRQGGRQEALKCGRAIFAHTQTVTPPPLLPTIRHRFRLARHAP